VSVRIFSIEPCYPVNTVAAAENTYVAWTEDFDIVIAAQ
jgi:hypothetical protein